MSITLPPLPEDRESIDANKLEEIAKKRPDEMFLKGSGVLKLISAIRTLERENRELADRASRVPMTELQMESVKRALTKNLWNLTEFIRAVEAHHGIGAKP